MTEQTSLILLFCVMAVFVFVGLGFMAVLLLKLLSINNRKLTQPSTPMNLETQLNQYIETNQLTVTAGDIINSNFEIKSAGIINQNLNYLLGNFSLATEENIAVIVESARDFEIGTDFGQLKLTLLARIGKDRLKITTNSEQRYQYFLNDQLIASSPVVASLLNNDWRAFLNNQQQPFLWHDRRPYNYQRRRVINVGITPNYQTSYPYNFYSDAALTKKIAEVSAGNSKTNLTGVLLGEDTVFLKFLEPNLDQVTKVTILGHLLLDRMFIN